MGPCFRRDDDGELLLANHARHAQESTKANAAAAQRWTVQRIIWKPRQESRDSDAAFEPRQRHPGALMGAGSKRKMPVWRPPDVERFRVGELPGIAVRRPDTQRHRRAGGQRDAAEFDAFRCHAVAELV